MPAAYSDYMVYYRSTNRPSLPTTSNSRVTQTSYARSTNGLQFTKYISNRSYYYNRQNTMLFIFLVIINSITIITFTVVTCLIPNWLLVSTVYYIFNQNNINGIFLTQEHTH